jgi:hypothetical protein
MTKDGAYRPTGRYLTAYSCRPVSKYMGAVRRGRYGRREKVMINPNVPQFIVEVQHQIVEAGADIVAKQQMEAGQPPLGTVPGDGYGGGAYGSGSYGS